MTGPQLTLPASGTVPAQMTLPQLLTVQALLELEHAVAGTLASLGRDRFDAGFRRGHEHAVGRPDAAEIEYASWMPDAGAIEIDSWSKHLRAGLR